MERIVQPQKIKKFFYEEVILLGRVFSRHENEEDLIFRAVRMLDWIYRRHTGRIGGFENETIEQMLKQPYQPHLGTIYLLEKHFPKIETGKTCNCRAIKSECIAYSTGRG